MMSSCMYLLCFCRHRESFAQKIQQQQQNKIGAKDTSTPSEHPVDPVFFMAPRQDKDGGILSSFVKAINDADYKEFYNTLERSQDITLFVPCNNAWSDDFTLNSIISNKNRFKDILKMHLVGDNRLYVDRIINIVNSKDKRVSCGRFFGGG
jgi:uncharacterized surface protein with fasciclin (FAS1) repeats